MSIPNLVGNAIWSTIAHLLGRGSLVVAAILLSRSLDTAAFAAYSYFQLTVSMLSSYAAMGLGVTASRFFSESGYVKNERMPPIGTLWILSIQAGIAFAILTLLAPASWLDGGLDTPQWLLSLGVIAIALGVVPSGGILGLEKYKEAALVAAISAAFLIIGVIIAGRANSHTAAMTIFVITSLGQSLVNTFIVLREVGWKNLLRHSRMGRSQLRSVAHFAGPMMAVSFLSASGSWIVGRIILSGPEGEHGFAAYAVGIQWYALALFIPGMISRVLLPRLIRMRITDGDVKTRTLVRQGSLATLIAAILISLSGFAASPWLIELYGFTHQVDKWLLGAFLLAAIPSAPINTIGNAIVAADGQKTWLLITIFWFIFTILLAKGFEEHGALGGAFALGLSSLAIAAVALATANLKRIV